MRRSLSCVAWTVCALLGCGSEAGSGGPFGTASSTADSGETGSAGTDSAGETADDADEGPLFDTPDTAGDEGHAEGCEKVDFLFVIDSSGSMGDNQVNLANSFPGFISTIQNTLKGQDYHIMVVDTDGKDICDGICEGGANFCALGGYDCADVPMLAGCDVELGAGKLLGSDKQPCPVAGGQRYMTQGQPDLASAFACVAQVGTVGDGNEQPVGAMLAAVEDAANMGGCNDGFLRDDAILVVTMLTDAPPKTANEQVAGDPVQWHDALVAAKNGNESAITMLGLVSDGDLPNGLCAGKPDDSAEGAPKMRDLVTLFGHHVLDSVCQPNYAPFFEEAVVIVDQSCDEFVPEG